MNSMWACIITALLLVVPMVSSELFTDDADLLKETRIIGGSEVEDGRYPYTVALMVGGRFGCGGTLISKDTVLTAAHCLRGSITVVIGSDKKAEGERIGVKKMVEHPNYNDNTDQYDMGLLFLEASTMMDITYPTLNNDADYPTVGTTTHVMGWGDTDAGTNQKVSDHLLIVDLDVISNSDCSRMERAQDGENISYSGWIFDDMLCTFSPGQDACQGDSGGPLIVQNVWGGPGDDILVGLVSWGVGCAFLPGVFSRVSASYDWIQTTVCEESSDPSPSLCGLRRLSPTDSPTTAEPTTASPTTAPSLSSWPTESPSGSPTLSSQPTSQPTDSPTISTSPSTSPSIAPSPSPTLSPTTSAKPSISSIPTREVKDERAIPVNSLLSPDALNEENVTSSSSEKIKGYSFVVIAVLCGMWMVL